MSITTKLEANTGSLFLLCIVIPRRALAISELLARSRVVKTDRQRESAVGGDT